VLVLVPVSGNISAGEVSKICLRNHGPDPPQLCMLPVCQYILLSASIKGMGLGERGRGDLLEHQPFGVVRVCDDGDLGQYDYRFANSRATSIEPESWQEGHRTGYICGRNIVGAPETMLCARKLSLIYSLQRAGYILRPRVEDE
jgi:hypothetical protein